MTNKITPHTEMQRAKTCLAEQAHNAHISPESQVPCCGFCKYSRDVKQPSVCSFWGDKVKFLDDACIYSEVVQND